LSLCANVLAAAALLLTEQYLDLSNSHSRQTLKGWPVGFSNRIRFQPKSFHRLAEIQDRDIYQLAFSLYLSMVGHDLFELPMLSHRFDFRTASAEINLPIFSSAMESKLGLYFFHRRLINDSRWILSHAD